jgi:hypothetical protein
MKYLYILALVVTLFYGCNTPHGNLEHFVTNPVLQDCLKRIINHEDSLQKIISTYGNIKSFTVTFSKENYKCFIEFVADFDYYDSHAMDGYFVFNGKFVSIYGLSSECGDIFINKKNLKHGLIPGLNDFDNKAFESAIKKGLPPPSTPPPREPYYRKYLISSPTTFIKVKDYDNEIEKYE